MIGSGASPVRFVRDSPQDALFVRIQTAIASTPSSTMGMHTRVLLALVVASGLSGAAVLIASSVVYHRYAPGLAVRASAPYEIVMLLLLGALAVVATAVATWRGRWGFGSGAKSLYVTIALVAPIYAALVAIGPEHTRESKLAGVAISVLGLRCLTLSAVVGLAVFATLTLALRRSIPVRSDLRGAAIGAAAGAWAGLGVFIFCPSDDLLHLFIAHVLPIVAFTVVGMTVLPRALRL